MNKIYQKIYLRDKSLFKSILSGFTLIELLVVVLIIAILAAAAVPQYEKAVERARAAEAIQIVSAIARANEVYKMANGSYTEDISLLDIQIPGADGIYNNWPRKETKLFQYGSIAQRYTDSVAVAQRLPAGNRYSLIALSDGKLLCFYYTDKYEKFCRGLSSGKVYDSDSYLIH